MAFVLSNFTYGRGTYNAGASQNAPAMHLYNAGADTSGVVNTDGYFNEIADSLQIQDVILLATGDTAPNQVSFVYVNALTPNVITIDFSG
jgi:hypothetical protein